MTPAEHARVKTIPESLIEGLAATTAHEVLGQSVIFSAFVAVGELLAKTILGLVEPVTKSQAVNRGAKALPVEQPKQVPTKQDNFAQVTLPLFALTA
jgi:DNA (cytosine-5)-methyltransferase 1